MGYANGIITDTNLCISDVKSVIGSSSNVLSTLCTHQNINKWARFKPVSGAWNSGQGDGTFGMSVPALSTYETSKENCIANWDEYWQYSKRPSGGSASPYRLGDFRHYDHNAAPPITVMYKTGSTYYGDVVYLAPSYTTFSAAFFSNKDTNITPSSRLAYCIQLSDIGGYRSNFSSWKLGLLNYHNASNISTHISSVALSSIDDSGSANLSVVLNNIERSFFWTGTRNIIYPVAVNGTTQFCPLPATPIQITCKNFSDEFTATVTISSVTAYSGGYTVVYSYTLTSNKSNFGWTWDSTSANSNGVNITFNFTGGSGSDYSYTTTVNGSSGTCTYGSPYSSGTKTANIRAGTKNYLSLTVSWEGLGKSQAASKSW